MSINELTRAELLQLIKAYDNYIYNGGEYWDADRQPVGVEEFFDNEYQE